jgi:hypothetical protein
MPSYLPITNILISNRREMFELLLHGLRAESIMEAMDVLLEYLRSLPAEEQAPIAVLLLRLDALVCSFKPWVSCVIVHLHLQSHEMGFRLLASDITWNLVCRNCKCNALQVEPNRNSTYREEATKAITHSLRCCLSDDNAVPSTRRALLLLGGHFTFSGDLLAEDWMLKQAGFIEHSRDTAASSDAVIHVLHT